MKVLVTGYEGYIGSVLVGMLTAHGHEVTGLDTGYFSSCTLGPPPIAPDHVIDCDVRQIETRQLEGFEGIVHLAALSNDPMGQFREELTDEINHLATVRLAKKAKQAGIERFVFSSSCSMYGVAGGEEAVTEFAPFDPQTAYARSKVDCETGLTRLADQDFSPVFLRNATAYGASPRIRLGTLVVNNLVGWAVTTGKIVIKSDGSPWRPLVHVEDICRAVCAVLVAPKGTIHLEAFNVGRNEDNYQVREIAQIVGEQAVDCEVTYGDDPVLDSRSYRVSFDKIAECLPGFRPQWDLRKGVDELLVSLREHNLTYDDFVSRQYTRLSQIEYLLAKGELDTHFRWTRARREVAK
jgi:nucleoside-diphosphate-sugar epimerase